MSEANLNTSTDETTALDNLTSNPIPTETSKPKRSPRPRKPKNKSESKPTNTNTSKPAPSFWRMVKDQFNTNNTKLVLIVVMSALPALSLFLSHKGGTLLTKTTNIVSVESALALLSFALCACVLAISLPHLAWSIEDITKSSSRDATILAVAFDLSIVACELLATAGHADTTTQVAMFALAALSSVLNCWAFIRKPAKVAKDQRAAEKANAQNA